MRSPVWRRTTLVGMLAVVGVTTAMLAPCWAAPVNADALTLDGCDPLDADQVRAFLGLEMSVVGRGEAAWPAIHVTCSGAMAQIALGTDPRGASHTSTLDMSGFPPSAKARLLAVEISVLLAPLLDTADPGATTRTPPQPSPAAPALVSTPSSHRRPRLELGVSVQSLGRPKVMGAGLHAGLAWPARSWCLLRGELRASAASWTVSPGTVGARELSLGTAMVLGASWARGFVGAGPGLRAGQVWLQRRAAALEGRGFDGMWWGPMGTALVAWSASARWWVAAGLEVGYVARPVQGEWDEATHRTVALAGPWFDATLSLALAL